MEDVWSLMSPHTTLEPSLRDDTAQRLYLELLKRVLTRTIVYEKYVPMDISVYGPTNKVYKVLFPFLKRIFQKKGLEIVRSFKPDWSSREQGRDWPPEAETMVGLKRLNNVQECLTDVLRSGVPGDILETGVWRGGCCIFMKAILVSYGDSTRNVWLADSFAGLPKPNAAEYPADGGDTHWTKSEVLAVPVEAVKENFRRYELLDDRVKFLKGWFKDTMPTAPIGKLAILRLDGDMYESTIQVLDAVYSKLSVGGYAIIDDYALAGCKAAVDDFRKAHGINDPISQVDWSGAYWKRSS
jgi:O-methyltransferase